MARKSKQKQVTEEELDRLERGEITLEELKQQTQFPEPKERKPRQTTTKYKFSSEDLAKKINLLFMGFSSLVGREPYIYTEADFIEEAESFNRLIAKFPPIGVFFMMIDPIIIVLNLFNKFKKLGKKKTPDTSDVRTQ